MKLATEVYPYIAGNEFHNGLRVKVSEKAALHDRIGYLCNYAKGKKVIHVGCVDHLPLIKQKIQNNTYLHERLASETLKLFGIDNSIEGIEFMRSELGYDNVAVEDILEGEINDQITGESWDSMIMAEILEHIDNPVHFLEKIRDRYRPYVRELVITVPNALAIANFFNSFQNTERINTDHRYWFSPYTLHKILHLSGFTPVSHEFATYYPVSSGGLRTARNFLLKYILKRNPVFRGDLIMIARF